MKTEIIIPNESLHKEFSSIIKIFCNNTNKSDQSKIIETLEDVGASLLYKTNLAKKLNKLISHQSDLGALLIRLGDRYSDDIPPTPSDHSSIDEHKLYKLDAIRVALIGSAGGKSYSYKDQAFGKLCDDVMPIKKFENVKGFSQGKNVGWHTEDAIYNTDDIDTSFDALSLCFLRGKPWDFTSISFPSLETISNESVKALSLKSFKSLASMSQGLDKNTHDKLKSVITTKNGFLEYRISYARINEQREYYASQGLLNPLVELKDCLDKNCIDILVKPGDILFFDNKRVFHARKNYFFMPNYDGKDRWQRRLGFSSEERFSRDINRFLIHGTRVVDNQKLMNAFNKIDSEDNTIKT